MEVAEQRQNASKPSGRKPHAPVETQPQKAKIEKTPSLKDMLNKIDSIGKESETSVEEQKAGYQQLNADQEAKTLSQAELTTQFEVFLDKIKKEQPRLHSAMKSQKAILNDNGNIEIFFQNNAQLEEFKQRLKPSLISHMRNSLGIAEIEVNEQVVDSEKLVRPKLFSDSERFKQLSEKNPALLKLKNLFSLDFE